MLLKLVVSTALLALVAPQTQAQSYVTEDPNRCPQPTDLNPIAPSFYYGNKGDCSYYYTCSHGNPTLMQCSPGTRWSDFFQTCVGYNGYFDTCTQENAIRECQRDPTLVIGHPSACQRFFNCSASGTPSMYSPFQLYEQECPYPQVFDIIQKECKSYKEGNCGPGRSPSKDGCDYYNNQCWRSHCIPCSVRFPSCVGKEDGVHGHPDRDWSPYTIVCEDERFVKTDTCPAHPVLSSIQLYSPVKDACVSLWEIPRDKGGLEPSCDGLAAGMYRTQERPDVYFSCPGVEVGYCPPGTQFSEDAKQCQ